MDGWVCPTGEKIRNYMAVTDTHSFLLKATPGGSKADTGQNIGTEALEVINEIGAVNFAGIVTDNAANETTSWDVVRDAHPEILATGCSCHAGNLLFKDVCEHQWAVKLLEKAVAVAKFIKHQTFTNAELKVRSIAGGKELSIILHCPARFAGCYYTIKRLLEVSSYIREIIVTDTFNDKRYENGDKISAIALDRTFWSDLAKLRLFLKPLKNFIRAMDHTQHTTHLLYPGLVMLHGAWTAMKGQVPNAFLKKALDHHKSRLEWMIFDIHYATYALSPEHHNGSIWTVHKVMKGLKNILKFYLSLPPSSRRRLLSSTISSNA